VSEFGSRIVCAQQSDHDRLQERPDTLGTMADEEKQQYVENLEALVKARTEQLRTAVTRIAELEKQLAELQAKAE